MITHTKPSDARLHSMSAQLDTLNHHVPWPNYLKSMYAAYLTTTVSRLIDVW